MRKDINELNIYEMFKGCIFVVPSEFLISSHFNEYSKIVKTWGDERNTFRGSFWIHTTSRFFYITALMKQFLLENVFHIENDVLIYTDLNSMFNKMKELKITDKIVAVQDADNRAVCSLVFLPNPVEANEYVKYIVESAKKIRGLNDMDLMGMYKNKYHFPDSPDHKLAKKLGVFDANAIGQYIGGVDFKNIPQSSIQNKYVNPTKGFINETSWFKPNSVPFYCTDVNSKDYNGVRHLLGTTPLDLQVCHVHSKQLYLYSSQFDIAWEDIITGDRIVAMCDFVIVDPAQFQYNSNLLQINPNVILVKDFKNINKEILNNSITEFVKKNKKDTKTLKVFVFVDLLVIAVITL
jgi:hypothetical protein